MMMRSYKEIRTSLTGFNSYLEMHTIREMGDAPRNPAPRVGRHYLSDATCHAASLFVVFSVVSRIAIICCIVCHF